MQQGVDSSSLKRYSVEGVGIPEEPTVSSYTTLYNTFYVRILYCSLIYDREPKVSYKLIGSYLKTRDLKKIVGETPTFYWNTYNEKKR